VLVVVLVNCPRAALVDDLNPCGVSGPECRPNGKNPVRMAGFAVQDGVTVTWASARTASSILDAWALEKLRGAADGNQVLGSEPPRVLSK
jgi:hypothetical protein